MEKVELVLAGAKPGLCAGKEQRVLGGWLEGEDLCEPQDI